MEAPSRGNESENENENERGGSLLPNVKEVGVSLKEAFGVFMNRVTMEREQLLSDIESAETYRDELNAEVAAMETLRRRWEKVISLNVGGTRFDVSHSTLTQSHPHSMLAVMFSGRHEVVWDSGCVFVDRDPEIFKYILTFLRIGPEKWREIKPVHDPLLLTRLRIEFDFFQLPFESEEEASEANSQSEKSGFGGGTLLTNEQGDILRRWHGDVDRKWNLLYKATRDGFNCQIFHRKCDRRGPTFTIIRSEFGGYLFGGYTSVSWENLYNITDRSAFLFTLTNPSRLPPTRFPVNSSSVRAVCYSRDSGPGFGRQDLVIQYSADTSRATASVSFSSFVDTTYRGATVYTGSTSFTVSEIEVYGV